MLLSRLPLLFLLAAPDAGAIQISLAQFNSWGVPLLVKKPSRYSGAMLELDHLDPDLMVIEEVFSGRARKSFHSPSHPYEARGPRWFPRLLESGVRILSRFPILSEARVAFKRCEGFDCLSHKGAVLVVLGLPDGGRLNLLATHLNAGSKESVRISQLDQIKQLIEQSGAPEAPLLIAGDFNFSADSESYSRMIQDWSVTDTWLETHSFDDPGITYDSFENSYARDYARKTHEAPMRARIDFVLHRDSKKGRIRGLGSRVIFNEEPFYSDHYGVLASFEVNTPTLE
jgi:endonuclease/exonuclease/phosphatase family metal-dependent hydrolase